MKKFYNTTEIAKLCEVSSGSVIRWIKEGKLKAALTAGGHRRVAGEDLARFLAGLGMPPLPSEVSAAPRDEKSELEALVGLYEASKAIFSTVRVDKLLETVIDLLFRALKVDEGSIMLLNKDNDLYIAASRGLSEAVVKSTVIKLGERVSGRAAKERREFLLNSGIDKYGEFKGTGANPRIQSSLVIPMVCRDELVGVLNMNRTATRENFTEADLRSASIFVSQVAQAVQNAKLYESLEGKIGELKKAYGTLDETKNMLVESEKLASIGRLVAGVAHEINNPLMAILGFSELLSGRPEISEEAREQLGVIAKAGGRCRDIVRNLLTFARRTNPEWKEVDPLLLIDETLEIASLEMKKRNVLVEKVYPQHCPALVADPNQLKQVFLNLLTNSWQALNEVEREKRVKIEVVTDANHLKIVFSDNGPGIKPEDLTKIFEPFFTTKVVGTGTGLGLSISYGIIQSHGGDISVESAWGQGAKFTIQLPLRHLSSLSAPKDDFPPIKAAA